MKPKELAEQRKKRSKRRRKVVLWSMYFTCFTSLILVLATGTGWEEKRAKLHGRNDFKGGEGETGAGKAE